MPSQFKSSLPYIVLSGIFFSVLGWQSYWNGVSEQDRQSRFELFVLNQEAKMSKALAFLARDPDLLGLEQRPYSLDRYLEMRLKENALSGFALFDLSCRPLIIKDIDKGLCDQIHRDLSSGLPTVHRQFDEDGARLSWQIAQGFSDTPDQVSRIAIARLDIGTPPELQKSLPMAWQPFSGLGVSLPKHWALALLFLGGSQLLFGLYLVGRRGRSGKMVSWIHRKVRSGKSLLSNLPSERCRKSKVDKLKQDTQKSHPPELAISDSPTERFSQEDRLALLEAKVQISQNFLRELARLLKNVADSAGVQESSRADRRPVSEARTVLKLWEAGIAEQGAARFFKRLEQSSGLNGFSNELQVHLQKLVQALASLQAENYQKSEIILNQQRELQSLGSLTQQTLRDLGSDASSQVGSAQVNEVFKRDSLSLNGVLNSLQKDILKTTHKNTVYQNQGAELNQFFISEKDLFIVSQALRSIYACLLEAQVLTFSGDQVVKTTLVRDRLGQPALFVEWTQGAVEIPHLLRYLELKELKTKLGREQYILEILTKDVGPQKETFLCLAGLKDGSKKTSKSPKREEQAPMSTILGG